MVKKSFELLLVEDNPGDVRLLRELLKEVTTTKFQIVLAEKLADIKACLESESFDLILLDLSLPDSQGLDTFIQVKIFAPTLPIIILTGLNDEHLAIEAMQAGAQDYLVKGKVDGDLLARSMRYAIERKRLQESLRQSEERWQLAVDGSNDGIWDFNAISNEYYFSPRCLEIVGYQHHEINSLEKWIECIHPDDLLKLIRIVQNHFDRPTEYSYCENRIRCKSGNYKWILLRGKAYFNEQRKPIRAVGSISDITDRKLAEEELKQHKEELELRVQERTAELLGLNSRLLDTLKEQENSRKILEEQAQLLELAHDTIITRDLDGKITFWNHGAEAMYGWKKAEALGKVFYALLKTRFPQPWAELEANLLAQGYWEGELVHTRSDGNTITVASRWVLQKDRAGNPVKILEINNDITDRKQAEEATAQLAAIVASSHDAIISKNLDGSVQTWNASAEHLFGYSAAEMIGKPISYLIPPDRQAEENSILAQLHRGERIQQYETVRQHKDGTLLDVSLTISPIEDIEGKIIGVSKIIRDITERRKIDRMKTEFISIVSHELRTPLTAIRGSLGLLAAGVYHNKPEKGKEMLEIAAQQTDRLVRLVNDILDLQRLESGKIQLMMQSCDAAALIEQSVNVMRGNAEANQITISVNAMAIQVWASADTIVQTLTNLLSNAIKFSPANSKISISVEAIDSAGKNPNALFQVKDCGRGIPADKIETIFERFQQVDASDARQKGGTGLGLAICRRIIEQHRGKIWAESVLGEGSCFYFTLPLAPSEKTIIN